MHFTFNTLYINPNYFFIILEYDYYFQFIDLQNKCVLIPNVIQIMLPVSSIHPKNSHNYPCSSVLPTIFLILRIQS